MLGSAILLTLAAPAGATDLTLRQRTTTVGPMGGTQEVTQYWTPQRVVTDSPDHRTIIDFQAETMTLANKQKRTYFTQTFAETREQGETMKAQLKQAFASLPPEARAQATKMGLGLEGSLSVKATGKHEKIAGYDAAEYSVSAPPIRGSVWASDALQPPGGIKAAEAYDKMMGSGPGGGFAKAMAQIKGVPLKTTIESGSGGQGFNSTTEVIEVVREPPPADVLIVPDGFTKTAAPVFRAMRPPRGEAAGAGKSAE